MDEEAKAAEAVAAEKGPSARTRGRQPEPVKWLDRLSAVLRQLKPPAPPATAFANAAQPPTPPWSPIVHSVRSFQSAPTSLSH